MTYPFAFKEAILARLGDEAVAFFEALEEPQPTSVLLNPSKSSGVVFPNGQKIPWCPHGLFLSERPSFIMDPLQHSGAYYVMEGSSMMLWRVMTQLFPTRKPDLTLDLCAAPGGKTMVLSTFLGEEGFLVSNEVNRGRFRILKENTQRWGMPNIAISNSDPAQMSALGVFDCILVDAPCSGEGLFRKSPDAIQEWSPSNVNHCSARQRRILGDAVRLLKPGGFLIYSTCTYNSDENVKNVNWMVNELGLHSVDLEMGEEPERVVFENGIGFQCWPHRMRGEGFFIAALQKEGDPVSPKLRSKRSSLIKRASRTQQAMWTPMLSESSDIEVTVSERGTYYGIPAGVLDQFLQLQPHIPGLTPSLELGEFKREDMIPSHALALSKALKSDTKSVALGLDDAVTYLRKEVPSIPTTHRGWVLATHRQLGLGWIKVAGQRVKNYFPTALRIRKRTP